MSFKDGELRVHNWELFQHYRHRSPPWIKLHKSLLDDPDWHAMSGANAKALMGIWLVASETDGYLPSSTVLAFRLRISEKECVGVCKSLWDNGFIDDACNVLAEGIPTARVEQSRVETEKNILTHSEEWPVRPKQSDGKYVYPHEFETAWGSYPKRGGDNPKVGAYQAFRARVKSGDPTSSLIASAANYREFCQATQKEGTEYVKQAATFWGPKEPWREFVDGMPPTNGNGSHVGNPKARGRL